jgi:hypothetical protein
MALSVLAASAYWAELNALPEGGIDFQLLLDNTDKWRLTARFVQALQGDLRTELRYFADLIVGKATTNARLEA